MILRTLGRISMSALKTSNLRIRVSFGVKYIYIYIYMYIYHWRRKRGGGGGGARGHVLPTHVFVWG